MTTLAPAATRANAARDGQLRAFAGESRRQDFRTQLRVQRKQVDGKDFVTLTGYASTVDQFYSMWDFWGPYEEQLAATAFDKTLAANPDVAFLLNHTGMTMARTTNGTLTLSVDETGLLSEATVNPSRRDVGDLVQAIDEGLIDQMSFAFVIVRGQWSSDYTKYTIEEVDLDRGDVSAVNYGANPNTSISARAKQAFDAIEHLEGAPLEAAAARAEARLAAQRSTVPVEPQPAGGAPEPTPDPTEQRGPNAATLRRRLELEEAGELA
jgi:HK97 family phage prohead protease